MITIDDLFEEQTLDVPCPKCGAIRQLTVPQLRSDPRFACAVCNQEVVIDASQFRDELKKAEEAFSDLQASFERLGGTFEKE